VDYSKKQVRYTLAILFSINLLNFYDRVIFGAVAEPIRKQWALTDSQVGWLATAFTCSTPWWSAPGTTVGPRRAFSTAGCWRGRVGARWRVEPWNYASLSRRASVWAWEGNLRRRATH
jgi:hypothetical protein